MHGSVWLVVFLLVCSDLYLLVNSKTRQTGLIHQSIFVHQAREIRSHRKTRQARQSRQSYPGETECRYQVALLDFPPYVMNTSTATHRGFMYEKIKWFVDFTCFGREEKDPEACIMEPVFVKNSEVMVELIKNKSVDFAFPIQADAIAALTDVPDVTLIRAFVSSGCSMIVNLGQCKAESWQQLLTSITSQWPIVMCMILLSGISGVVIWLLEHRAKNGQFSRSFAAGTPEGFWWAVLSLTTVGYGDVTPRTLPGRIFGIIWVLVGAVMMAFLFAVIIYAVQATFDGTKCKDIYGKEMGVSVVNTETQIVAKEFNADIIKFNNLKEMQKNLSEGIIGRVLMDRNTAFHFLDKSGLKRNRQIRLVRNIDYPFDYFLAHVGKGLLPTPSVSPNDTDESYSELARRKEQLADCGEDLKDMSVDLVAVSKTTAEEQLIPAELQTTDLSYEMEVLFSTGFEMTKFILFYLLGIFLGLIAIGMLWEVYTKCSSSFQNRRRALQQRHVGLGDSLGRDLPDLVALEERLERLKDSITVEIERIKEEIATTITNQDTEI